MCLVQHLAMYLADSLRPPIDVLSTYGFQMDAMVANVQDQVYEIVKKLDNNNAAVGGGSPGSPVTGGPLASTPGRLEAIVL